MCGSAGILSLGIGLHAASGDTDGPSRADRSLGPAPVLSPTGVPAAGQDRAGRSLWLDERGELVREGSFLRNRRGRLVRAEGEWVYVFDADAKGQSEPPMVMQPCRRLREMQQTLERRSRSITFQTTGEVFAYDGRNYFLPTFFSVIAVEAAPTASAEAPDQPSDPKHDTSSRTDPSAADLLKEMSGPSPRASIIPRGPAGIAEGGTERTAEVREGVSLVSRRGRVVRDGGSLTFVTDNDDAAKSLPPMTLMPCLNLEAIDRILRQHGPGSVFLMSGRVFAHEGRNFLLPTFFQVERDREGNMTPVQ